MQDDRFGVGTSLMNNGSNHARTRLNSARPHENPTGTILVRRLGLVVAYFGDEEEEEGASEYIYTC